MKLNAEDGPLLLPELGPIKLNADDGPLLLLGPVVDSDDAPDPAPLLATPTEEDPPPDPSDAVV